MKKWLLLIFFSFSHIVFAGKSLASEVCDKYFINMQKLLFQEESEARPYTTLRRVFNTLTSRDVCNKGNLVQDMMHEKAAMSFHLLCNELDKSLTQDASLKLAAEFDFVFDNDRLGHFDRLCGLENPEKITVESLAAMGRKIYDKFERILEFEDELKSFAYSEPNAAENILPTKFVFSANDPAAAIFDARCPGVLLNVELLADQPRFLEIAEEHWSSKHLKELTAKANVLVSEMVLIDSINSLIHDKISTKVKGFELKRAELMARFERVEKQPLVAWFGDTMQCMAYACLISSTSKVVFPSIKKVWYEALGKIPVEVVLQPQNALSSISLKNNVEVSVSRANKGLLDEILSGRAITLLGEKVFNALDWGPTVLITGAGIGAKCIYAAWTSTSKEKKEQLC